MKILQVNNCFPNGSTGKITNDIHNYLINNNYDSIVCYANGKKINQNNVIKISNVFFQKIDAFFSRLTGLMYGGCFFQTYKLINIIKKEKPDIVHIHCINGHTVNIYKFIKWLNHNNVNTVITLHAEFIYTANCGYSLECDKWKSGCGNCPRYKKCTNSFFKDNTAKSWINMFNSFKKFKNIIIVSVSPWLKDRAIQSPILCDFEHDVVLNGLDTNIFKIRNNNNLANKFKDKKIIFHATPRFTDDKSHIKGGFYVLELAKKLKNDNVQIFVAGPYDKDLQVPDNITLLGNISDQKLLAEYYSIADVFVLTSKKETFSMTTAESLCCGTPVVGFYAGAPEQIALKDFSSFVEYGNIDELYNEILKFLSKPKNSNISKCANNKYSKETMAKNYINVYNRLLK